MCYPINVLVFVGFWLETKYRRQRFSFGFLTAILILLLLRWSSYSLNPIFSSLGLSLFVSFLLPFASFALYFEFANERRRYLKVQEIISCDTSEERFLFVHNDRRGGYVNITSDTNSPVESTLTKLDVFCNSAYKWVSISMAVGSMLFLVHFLWTSPQTIERFVGIFVVRDLY